MESSLEYFVYLLYKMIGLLLFLQAPQYPVKATFSCCSYNFPRREKLNPESIYVQNSKQKNFGPYFYWICSKTKVCPNRATVRAHKL